VPVLEDAGAGLGAAPRKRVEFPHAKHLGKAGAALPGKLAAGCFACHDLKTGEAGAFDATVFTKDDARSCLDCHRTHQEIGGGACASCHRAGDPVYAFDPSRGAPSPVVKAWPKPSGFSHWSPGHAPIAKCDQCHQGASAVDGAGSVVAVRLPQENDPSCRDCHLRKGARFHWR
jgi:hypothetical protein